MQAATASAEAALAAANAGDEEEEDPAFRETERDEAEARLSSLQNDSSERWQVLQSNLVSISEWFGDADVAGAIDEEHAKEIGAAPPPTPPEEAGDGDEAGDAGTDDAEGGPGRHTRKRAREREEAFAAGASADAPADELRPRTADALFDNDELMRKLVCARARV